MRFPLPTPSKRAAHGWDYSRGISDVIAKLAASFNRSRHTHTAEGRYEHAQELLLFSLEHAAHMAGSACSGLQCFLQATYTWTEFELALSTVQLQMKRTRKKTIVSAHSKRMSVTGFKIKAVHLWSATKQTENFRLWTLTTRIIKFLLYCEIRQ